MSIENCGFSTERLFVSEWHSLASEDWDRQPLEAVVRAILTPAVTETLPPPWQGEYTDERARKWIRDRDREGVTLMVIERGSGRAVGLMLLFSAGEAVEGAELRLGYMLAESAWGRGYASELIAGLIGWCRSHRVLSLTGGVARENIASGRALEKNGFRCEPGNESDDERTFVLCLE